MKDFFSELEITFLYKSILYIVERNIVILLPVVMDLFCINISSTIDWR